MPLRTTARMTAFSPGQSPPPVSTPIRMRRHHSDEGSILEVALQPFYCATHRRPHRLGHAFWCDISAVDEDRAVVVLEHVDRAEVGLDRHRAADDAVLEPAEL